MVELERIDSDELQKLTPAESSAGQSKVGPVRYLIGIVFAGGIALFSLMAGIMLVFSFGPSAGQEFWIPLLFCGLFFYVSLHMLLRLVRSALTPEWQVMARSDMLTLGQTAQIEWRTDSRAGWIKTMQIDLESHEVAVNTKNSTFTYSTERRNASLMTIADKVAGHHLIYGSQSFTMPQSAPPSFKSQHNKVVWLIALSAKMKWPMTVTREFRVTVIPPPVDEAVSLPAPESEPASPAAVPADGPLTIRTAGNRTHFVPGEEISGSVTWQCDRPDDRVELRLLWFTQGKGDQDRSIVERLSLDAAAERGEFRLRLPSDAPCSFCGKMVAVVWALELAVMPSEAVQKERGFFQGKLKENTRRLELIVSPTGEELIYTPEPAYAS